MPVRPLSIKRLIINLVNNAIRYGREPIYIGASILPPATDEDAGLELTDPHAKFPKLIIHVKDEGEGVADDQLERIMQPFERGRDSTHHSRQRVRSCHRQSNRTLTPRPRSKR
ncbi:Osmolarity sensor protein EnvZ [Moraxella ovis]|nr:Osmolarity sensor protein EnvZ [Moraxella ovis]